MTPEEFRAWLARHDYTQARAAELLGSSQPAVSRWAAGERRVPGPVVRLIERLERERTP